MDITFANLSDEEILNRVIVALTDSRDFAEDKATIEDNAGWEDNIVAHNTVIAFMKARRELVSPLYTMLDTITFVHSQIEEFLVRRNPQIGYNTKYLSAMGDIEAHLNLLMDRWEAEQRQR